MSLTVAASTSQTLTFGPSRIDIRWDGVSNGKVSVLPVCSNTQVTSTYSVKVLHVFPEATTKVLYFSNTSATYAIAAGDPFLNNRTSTAVSAAPFTVGSTLATATGIVSFELIPSDTNYTAAFDVVSHTTSKPAYYKWSLEQSRGTAVQTVAAGRLSRLPPNPFVADNASGSLVQSQTASFCIG